MGGELMGKAGMEVIAPMPHVMGITDVIKALPKLYKTFRKLKKWILKEQPDAVVFIDYAEFNLLMAKALRKKGFRGKLIHYVSPSVWAWRKSRIKQLAATLDHLLTILPFEKAYFKQTSLPVTYVGHPLAKTVIKQEKLDLPQGTVALFPGSRVSEIKRNLPLQLAAAKGKPVAVSVARAGLKPLIHSLAPEALLVPGEKRSLLMSSCQAAIATSGTITFELALHNVPTVVTYKLSAINYFLGRHVFRIHIPYFSLPNLISQKELFPEFIHSRIFAHEVANSLDRLIEGKQFEKESTAFHTRLEAVEKTAADTILEILI